MQDTKTQRKDNFQVKYFVRYLETFGYSRTLSRRDVQIIGQYIRMIALSVGLLKKAL